MRRAAAVIVLAVLVAGLLVPPASAAPRSSPAPSTCASPIPTETYEVTAKARRDSYRLGDIVKIDVFVTDSITGLPAQDVDAALGIKGRGDNWLLAGGQTNEQGHVLLGGPLKPAHFEPGWAHAHILAWEWFITPLLCADRYGYAEYRRLFRITR